MGAMLIAGCGIPAAQTGPAPAGHTATRTAHTGPSTTNPLPPVPSAAASSKTAARETPPVVVLDPGHNGGNAANPDEINRQVPAGRGRTKPCNTTGTATDDGYPEHAFTFDVAQRVRRILTDRGFTVILTRPDDTGVGPCVNRRAAIGNESAADAVVSIHADGHENRSAGGFHIIYPAPPLNDAQGEPTVRLAHTMRAAMLDAGFGMADYIGSQGLAPRDDIAGLNLSQRPAVLVECGNMRNGDEAVAMTSQAGRRRYADAIATGIIRYME